MTSAVTRQATSNVATIGPSVVIKGQLVASEDLIVDGQVEGKVEVRESTLTIGPHGQIQAEIFAKSVVVLGHVKGNITATTKVDIRENGCVDGDILAPSLAIADGARFRGSIDMQRASEAVRDKPPVPKNDGGKLGVPKPATLPADAPVTRRT